MGEFVRLEHENLTVTRYEAKFTELSRFAPLLIATEEEKTLKVQDGLKSYLKNKISILKLNVYLEVIDRTLIVEKDNEELHQYRKQQGKKNRMVVLMVTKYRKNVLQVEIRIKKKQHKIWMEFVLLVARSMRVGHAIERQ